MSVLGQIAATRRGPFTYQDLLNTPDDGKRYEVVEGELVVSPAPSWRHQRIVQRVNRLLNRAEEAGYGLVVAAPTDVVLADHEVCEPDLLFITRQRTGMATETHVSGAPDLVVEILSESTRKRDVTTKRRIYERYGVRFYWIVDPEEETVRVFALHEGKYPEPVTLRTGQELSCPLFPGVTADVGSFFGE